MNVLTKNNTIGYNTIVDDAEDKEAVEDHHVGEDTTTIETTYLAVTLTTNTVTNDEADTVTKKKKKKKTILCVLSVAAACAAVLFMWGALVSRSSGTPVIAEAGVALEGVASYPKVNIKNKTTRPASGMVEYLAGASVCEADLYHVNPGEIWTAPKDRGVCLVRCVTVFPDAPIPFNIAEKYQSTGTSYAAFEIVFTVDDGFKVVRPGGNRSGPHLEACGNFYPDKTEIEKEETCGKFNKYHSVWPPIDGKC